MKGNLKELDKFTITVGNFTIPTSNRTSRQNHKKYRKHHHSAFKLDMYRTLHSTTQQQQNT